MLRNIDGQTKSGFIGHTTLKAMPVWCVVGSQPHADAAPVPLDVCRHIADREAVRVRVASIKAPEITVRRNYFAQS